MAGARALELGSAAARGATASELFEEYECIHR
jgi:hypothetical protein